MRPMRRFAASGKLTRSLAASAAVSVGVFAAALAGPVLMSAPAIAASANPPGAAVAFASPSSVTPGTAVTFQVTCGSLQATSATLFGTTLGLPEQIPMTKGASGDVFSVTVTLPASIRPATYNPDIDCSDGSSAVATLHVTAMPSGGGAETGDGTTSTTTDAGLSVGGLALIAGGAVVAGLVLRRRSGTRG
jgi:hypothetical protein